ncbi:CAP domain-containing protein [Shimazuella kribbensis]|uniref:CAP domain-containing protein n=1 Tax=Shimazuella kribbensis TaxID=139808 RepID=UPI0003FE654F|nr:CAP domain-containing protein [Shimazuella kribbensis]
MRIVYFVILPLLLFGFVKPTGEHATEATQGRKATVTAITTKISVTNLSKKVKVTKKTTPSTKNSNTSKKNTTSKQTQKSKPIAQKQEESIESKPTQSPAAPNHSSESASSNSDILAMEREVVRLVNIERSKKGLQPLVIDDKLCKIARTKSQDMKDKNYFSHQSPTYGSPFDMLKHFGVSYRTAGENLAAGYPSASAVVNGWMNSEGHRKNILNPAYSKIGVGYVSGGSYGNYWTQLFTG